MIWFILISAIIVPSVFCETNRYVMHIRVNKTSFSETIAVDDEKQVESFSVPAHGNVDGVDIINDFIQGVSVTRVLSRQACYLSSIDEDLPPPRKLEADLDQSASMLDVDQTETSETKEWIIDGFADRSPLSQEMLDLCKGLPIFRLKRFSREQARREAAAFAGSGRLKRQTALNFKPCSSPTFKHVSSCKNREWNVQCKINSYTCSYYTLCHPGKYNGYECNTHTPCTKTIQCCDFICP